jgi:hypothetical protein
MIGNLLIANTYCTRQQKVLFKGPGVSAAYAPHYRYPRSTFALAMTSKHPPGPPMRLGNMREPGGALKKKDRHNGGLS